MSASKKCDYCKKSGPDVVPCVEERYIQYVEGLAGFDAPCNVGLVCERCREEEFDGKAVPAVEF